MLQRDLTLTNRRGLHARAATRLVQCCQPFESRVTIYHGERCADAGNIMSLLMLAAPCTSVVQVHVEGEDAEETLAAIVALFDARFDEDQ
ncbi:phosphocarrier protein NPr [Kushneria avicenniae]|uniref:Phosphocarrier protein NPr n=1 Tax=Kushneria avicenniae TaxID=402385 RepID=A0A1I1MIJ8_9GAMM|nr:HPr family phosphocarrier protein [Kushneria avicenniae]SFC81380.1 phosphocarrier protein NPr [Kushneria avicenniae]